MNIAIASMMMLFTTVVHIAGITLVLVKIKARVSHWRHQTLLVRARKIGEVSLLMFSLTIAEALAWAEVYLLVGAFEKMEEALYFSLVTFTTLGYGDLLLDERWRLMGALQAANGIIIFGLTTAAVIAVVQVVYSPDSSG